MQQQQQTLQQQQQAVTQLTQTVQQQQEQQQWQQQQRQYQQQQQQMLGWMQPPSNPLQPWGFGQQAIPAAPTWNTLMMAQGLAGMMAAPTPTLSPYQM